MCEFIHYTYRPKSLYSINYNPTLINYLLQYSKNKGDLQNLILYGPIGTSKKTLIQCTLNNYFNNDNTIYNTTTFNYTLSNNYKIHYIIHSF